MSENVRYCLTLDAVSKAYGVQPVFTDLSLRFRPGRIVLILGANGSGKTTLLRLCAGLTRPDNGSIRSGEHLLQRSERRTIGYLGHESLLYSDLTAVENLELVAALVGVTFNPEEHLAPWLGLEHAKKRLSELSQGQQRRVALARAFLHKPRLLFLDEPTSTLDEQGVGELLTNIEAARSTHPGDGLVMIATHDVERLAPYGDRIIVLRNGTVNRDTVEGTNGTPLRESEALRAEVVRQYLRFNR